ncbi:MULTISPECIES: sulfite exporter TauE/SafE family protein [unclassified Rubrivivax]|uniref:sulfite exporter TauE/SafE family protein n=1 Tax=unclassified Rubrivivax TaxID=2649762 RepID=UPI001E4C1A52|nr:MULTISPECIES: sulfite exporter TauE/SafE family protein [unclassified Rubrivivax]MCC9597905.1 sulfite exporter TauE/SafE family protein [Rubrivivax sp. JA1055]MCC9645838.1 sulfite exporter TauE/SafE family protein [Rubrivivax sp. JA1029]
MDFALVVSALMLGLAGAPHCIAMCGAACTAVLPRGQPAALWSFHLARVLGYAMAGALVASGVNLLSAVGELSPALRPLWTLAHAAALALGVWLVWKGRQPQWLENIGRSAQRRAPQADAGGWQRIKGPARAATAGSLWVAWPCGLLQSALVVAALANTAAAGAAAMGAFAVASGAGLVLGPMLWLRLGVSASAAATTWATRAAGALLALASGWALGHGLWMQWQAYCAT